MSKIFLTIILLCGAQYLEAQKYVINHSTSTDWPIISSEKISDDGNFLIYRISTTKSQTLIIKATHSSWKREMSGATEEIRFAGNNRWLIFRNAGDSIGIFDLIKDSLFYIGPVSNFAASNGTDGQWIAFQAANNKKELAIIDLVTGEERRYPNVKAYLFSSKAQILLMQIERLKDSILGTVVLWRNLANGKDTIISEQDGSSDFAFDDTGTKLAFLSLNEKGSSSLCALRYYQSGMDSAHTLVYAPSAETQDMVIKKESAYFSAQGDRIFFYLEKQVKEGQRRIATQMPGVKILNYQDDSLQFERIDGPYLCVIDLQGNRAVRRLGQSKDFGYWESNVDDENYIVFRSRGIGSQMDYHWRHSAAPDFYLVSVRDGVRKLLKRHGNIDDFYFSHTGKFVIWYDPDEKNWFAYDIINSRLRNITGEIHSPLYIDQSYSDNRSPVGIAGWMENDESVLIYDQWDIWLVDPKGITRPVNLTHGYGVKNNIGFRCVNFGGGKIVTFHWQDTLLLTAFNFNNKDNGFFKMPLSGQRELHLLGMEPRRYFYYPNIEPNVSGVPYAFLPLKAKCENLYVVKRMSESEYPNLYMTADFERFSNLTELAPQKKYNWYKTELIHWKLFNGKDAEGILYKPENFDTHKKYPIIFYYYERNSDGLNIFIHPELSNGQMNIPWFVSNGYLVFVPNVYYKIGNPGVGVYSSIVSAGRFFSKMPWVDARHMGLQGHSFGGWETNYIIAHTSLFAAAASSAGVSDFVSMYEHGLPDGWYYERGQGRMGVTLWEDPQAYIDNSPVFNADKVSCPLLIMHNKMDGPVPYRQGLYWFNALTRLGKKVWMLSYEDEEHFIHKEENELDYSIRLGQFFDYFLKGAPAPKWMIRGVDSYDEEIDYGLETTLKGAIK